MSSRRRSGHDDDDDGDTDNDSSTSLGERMKAYEEKTNIRMDLTARPFMVRLDGNSFSTFTKPFVKPFDPELHKAIVLAAGDAMERYNALTAYVCSDEISLVFPYETENQDKNQIGNMLFGGRIQKIVSLLAGYTSMRFNHHLINSTMFAYEDWREQLREKHRNSLKYLVESRKRGKEKADRWVELQIEGAEKSVFGGMGIFDSRIFPLPSKEEVAMNIIWRSKFDCVRNSKSLLGTIFYRQSQLNNVPADKVVKMLQDEYHIDWNDMDSTYKYGTFIKKEEYMKDGFNPITKETVKTKRRRLRAKSFLIERNNPALTARFLYADTWNMIPDDDPFWRTTVGLQDLGSFS